MIKHLILGSAAPKEVQTPKPVEDEIEKSESVQPQEVFKTPDAKIKRKSDSTPEVSSEKIKKLTPKQLARKAELEKQKKEKEAKKEAEKQAKEAERLKEKERKEAEKQKEKDRKEAERKAKEAQKEAEKKAKETEKLEKERLKQEKEAEKQREKDRKEAEKKAKEAAKEAEKKAKEAEKEEKEKAEKAKAEKAKQSFASFFVKKEKVEEKVEDTKSENSIFTQFQVKSNMKIAPLSRAQDKCPDFELNQDVSKSELYLSRLRKGQVKAGKQGRTWPYAPKVDDDIEIIEEDDDEDDIGEEILNDSMVKPTANNSSKVFKKAKLLQFHDNQRPAYFGTWTKKTAKISGRKPFGEDKELFDYDYDSDEDWEEEEQGESLSDEEKDKEEDEKEDEKCDEDDDGFFVGHGVLDKDELKNDDEDDEAFDEELEIKKQKLKAQQFEEEYKKKKPIKLKPRVFGCFWNDPDHAKDKDDQVRIAHEQFIKILTPFKAVVLQMGLIQTSLSQPKVEEKESPNTAQATKAKILKEFPEEAMLDFIKLIHANPNNKIFLAKEFVEFWSSKKSGEF